jgi:hypothetical protein
MTSMIRPKPPIKNAEVSLAVDEKFPRNLSLQTCQTTENPLRFFERLFLAALGVPLPSSLHGLVVEKGTELGTSLRELFQFIHQMRI